MNILLGLTDDKDFLLLQALLLLRSRGIYIDQVKYIRTFSNQLEVAIHQLFLSLNVSVETYPLHNNGRLVNEEDYLHVEEQLFEWYSEVSKDADKVYVFVGGGHKLHSLALQKCAFLLGSEDIFHMFVNVPRNEEPKTINDIQNFIAANKILYASLGKENGWPALKNLFKDNKVSYQYIKELTEKVGSRNIEDINEYPFESLSLLPAKALEWLSAPVCELDRAFINSLPKVELHCHLGGFASHGILLDQVRAAADDSCDIGPIRDLIVPADWPLPDKTVGLLDYMNLGDNTGSYILKNRGCLIKHIDLLYLAFIQENIGYAEVRCSPYNYQSKNFSGLEVLKIIKDRFDYNMDYYKNKSDFWCHVNIILIATRTDTKNTTRIEEHLKLAVDSESLSKEKGRCKIVGVDLAGFEHPSTRASYFSHLFEPIHRKGIALTIHAGENDDSESIWDAVFRLNTRRIGHGLNLYQDQNLLKSIVNRGIGIEMCPYANYQIVGFKPMPNVTKNYPLIQYLRQGAQVTINTDNIGISNASITDNFLLASKMNPDLTRIDVLRIIRNGLEQAFIDVELKNKFIKIYNNKIFNTIFSSIQ